MAGKEQVNLDLTATDDASKVIDKVGDKVDDLEKHPAEVEVDADTKKAVRTLDDLEGHAKKLAGQDWIVEFKADIDKAKKDAAELEDQLKRTGRAGKDAGDDVQSISGEQRVSAMRDLTGPLGDVSSGVGDLGDSFVAAGSQIESAMGMAEGSLTNLLGPIGIVAGAAFTFWNMWKKNADEARQRVNDLADAMLEVGQKQAITDALTDLVKKNDDLRSSAADLGLNLDDLVQLVNGRQVPAFAAAKSAYDKLIDGTGQAIGKGEGYMTMVKRTLGLNDLQARALVNSALSYQTLQGELSTTTGEVGKAIDRTKDYQVILGKTPPHVTTTYQVIADATALEETKKEQERLQRWFNEHPVIIPTKVSGQGAQGFTPGAIGPQSVPVPQVSNVTIHVPRGMRAADVIAAGNAYARRNGGRRARR